MPKHTLFITALIVLISLSADGQNFLTNPGFEIYSGGGFADEWNFAPAGSASYVQNDAANANSGSDYIQSQPGVDGWAVAWTTEDIKVVPGVEYTMTVYIADAVGGGTGNNLSGMAGVKIEWYSEYGDPYASALDLDSVGFSVPKDGNYYAFTVNVTNDSGASFARPVLTTGQVSGQSKTFNFDDVTFGRRYPLAKPDFNNDFEVNLIDFSQFASTWNQSTNTHDIDGNGVFDEADLGIFMGQWLRTRSDYSSYELVWSDDFDGVELDYENWSPEVGDAWYNGELQSYTARPENVYVQDGTLVIVGRNESYHGNDYTSARLRTKSKQDFLYGRMEARIKLPATQGMWPAFWMMPTESVYGGWSHSGEIDIMEALNLMTQISGALHYTKVSGDHDSWSTGFYTPSGWNPSTYHVFAIEWEPTRFRWYVDDTLFGTVSSWNSDTNPYPAPFDQDFYFILNLAIGGWPGSPDGTSVFPQYMLVDYVRAYQKTP